LGRSDYYAGQYQRTNATPSTVCLYLLDPVLMDNGNSSNISVKRLNLVFVNERLPIRSTGVLISQPKFYYFQCLPSAGCCFPAPSVPKSDMKSVKRDWVRRAVLWHAKKTKMLQALEEAFPASLSMTDLLKYFEFSTHSFDNSIYYSPAPMMPYIFSH